MRNIEYIPLEHNEIDSCPVCFEIKIDGKAMGWATAYPDLWRSGYILWNEYENCNGVPVYISGGHKSIIDVANHMINWMESE